MNMLSCDYAINAPAGDYVVATFDDLFSIEGIILLFSYLPHLFFFLICLFHIENSSLEQMLKFIFSEIFSILNLQKNILH